MTLLLGVVRWQRKENHRDLHIFKRFESKTCGPHILNRFGSKTCGCMHKREDGMIFEWGKSQGKIWVLRMRENKKTFEW